MRCVGFFYLPWALLGDFSGVCARPFCTISKLHNSPLGMFILVYDTYYKLFI